MNLLNDLKLARRLKAGEVLPEERFHYLLVTVFVSTLLWTSFLAIKPTSPDNFWDYATDAASLIFAFLGIILIYATNKDGDDKELIERFICLSVPITVQLTLAAMLIYGIYTFSSIGGLTDKFWHDAFLFAFDISYYTYFYLRLNYSMKIASH